MATPIGLDNLVHGELAPLFVDIAVMEILALRYENARLRKRLYDMMDEHSVEVFSAEAGLDRLTNDVIGL